jgi:hypothetical protein
MQGQTHAGQRYVLGNHAEELARLDHQAAVIERPTRLLLQAAGLTAGMRVLDLGTGLGHVARLAGELVGPMGPPVVIVDTALRWVHDAFRAAGAWPRIGARLGTILEDAQLTRVTTFGVQAYLSPRDSSGPRLLAGVVRSLAPAIIAHGLATGDELDLTTLERRIAEAVRDAGAVILPPTVVGAWGHVPD